MRLDFNYGMVSRGLNGVNMIKRLKQWMKRHAAVASTGLLERDPTDAEAGSACTYFRHDFPLLPSHERKELMFEAELWLIAWKKVNEDSSNEELTLRNVAKRNGGSVQ